MKTSDLKSKSIDELGVQLKSQLDDQFKYRMQKSTGQLAQTHLLKQARKNIARIKTLLKEKAGA